MSLTEINFSDLSNYEVKPLDMTDLQTGLFEQLRTHLKNSRTPGVISGCEILPGNALDVKIQPGLILMPDGKIVYIAEEQILALDAADGANPRVDRIEVDFSLQNLRSGTNVTGQAVVISKSHIAVLSKVTGVPLAEPVIPAKSSGKISLGSVLVGALASGITSSVIETSFKSKDVSREKIIQDEFPVLNAQAAPAPIRDFIVDKTKYKQMRFVLDIYREDNAQSATARVEITLILNIKSGDWVFFREFQGEEGHGITLLFDQAKQQVFYTSSDFNAGAYDGTFSLKLVDFMER